jgi:hypothetical protein
VVVETGSCCRAAMAPCRWSRRPAAGWFLIPTRFGPAALTLGERSVCCSPTPPPRSRKRLAMVGRPASREVLSRGRWESMSKAGGELAETIIGLYKAEFVHRRGPWKGIDDVDYAASTGSTGSTAACLSRAAKSGQPSSSQPLQRGDATTTSPRQRGVGPGRPGPRHGSARPVWLRPLGGEYDRPHWGPGGPARRASPASGPARWSTWPPAAVESSGCPTSKTKCTGCTRATCLQREGVARSDDVVRPGIDSGPMDEPDQEDTCVEPWRS